MSRRNENIRKSCDLINYWIDIAINAKKINPKVSIIDSAIDFHVALIEIRRLTHRIKRTTWRGDKPKVYVTTDTTTSSSGQYATDY